jgi:formylglycine-generating enzyme required for sulfatase activity
MQNLIRDFGNRLADTKGVGLFFYAGHGIAANGMNFLIPVDADIQAEDEIDNFSVSMDFLLGKMASAGNGFNMVILDACRNNPFARSWRNYRDIGDKGGLARVNAPTGTLIAYATKPGDVASDGDGRNGLYTSALLEQMKLKDVDVTKMLQNVRAEVLQKSNNKQVPFDESSLVGDFYFAGKSIGAQKVDNSQPKVDKTMGNAAEISAWNLIKESKKLAEIESFIKFFPNSVYNGQAKKRYEQVWWDSVKDERDRAKFEAFLNKFPDGIYAPVAKLMIEQLGNSGGGATVNEDEKKKAGEDTLKAGQKWQNSLKMEFSYIPPGTFLMGSNNGGKDEKPVHMVKISQGFWMQTTEVTQAQWATIMGNNPSSFSDCLSCPVERVSWEDIQIFILKLNARGDGHKYRLPSEAEWEYAARAGTTGDYAGDIDLMSWNKDNARGKPHPVGTKQPNEWGLYDMHGNVWEWVNDWYGDYPGGTVTDPSGPTSGSKRIFRGGGWSSPPDGSFVNPNSNLRSASRSNDKSSSRDDNLGFRLVRN